MRSIKQWHKIVLLACIAIVLFSGTVKAQPDDFVSGPQYIVNAFELSASAMLDSIWLWTNGYQTYEVTVYDSFSVDPGTGAGTFGTPYATGFSSRLNAGHLEVELDSSVLLSASTPYYVHVMAYAAPSHGVSFDSPADNTSYYLTGATWNDLYDTQAGLTFAGGSPAPANFVMDLNTSSLPNITATGIGTDWTITSGPTFTEPNTLDMGLEATEMKPFVMEIDVESEMEQITLTEEVLNSITERDWIGFGFQLGYWDEQNQRFVASTAGDGLNFGYSTSTEFGPATTLSEDHIQFGNGFVEPGETASFALLINLPGGSDNFTFALQQYAVPEPSTFLLLAMSGVMMLLCGRRR